MLVKNEILGDNSPINNNENETERTEPRYIPQPLPTQPPGPGALSPPPLDVTLTATSNECDLSGKIPFKYWVDFKLRGDRIICVLLELRCRRGVAALIRDSNNKQRGPWSDGILCEMANDEEEEFSPEYRWNITDPATIRFRPGDRLRLSYTLTVDERTQGGYPNNTRADTHYLNSGEMYRLVDTGHFAWWIYEDSLPDPMVSQKVLKKILTSQPRTKTELAKEVIEFRAVGEHPETRGTRKYGIVEYQFLSG